MHPATDRSSNGAALQKLKSPSAYSQHCKRHAVIFERPKGQQNYSRTRCKASCLQAGSYRLGSGQAHYRRHTARCAAAAAQPFSLQSSALQNPAVQNAGAMIVSIALGLVLVKVFDSLSHRDIVNKKLSRKLVHMLAGPGFMLCWPLFSVQASARYFAAVVPSINIVRLLLIGLGIVQDDRTVKSVSRSGDRGELLRGPLYYVIVLLAATLTLWRTSPVPAVALALMCGGDGLADIAGRNIRGPSLPHNPRKTWAGSIAMFIGGSAMALGFLIFFSRLHYFEMTRNILPVVAGSSLAATVAESLPISDVLDDNMTVPVVAAAACVLLLQA